MVCMGYITSWSDWQYFTTLLRRLLSASSLEGPTPICVAWLPIAE